MYSHVVLLTQPCNLQRFQVVFVVGAGIRLATFLTSFALQLSASDQSIQDCALSHVACVFRGFARAIGAFEQRAGCYRQASSPDYVASFRSGIPYIQSEAHSTDYAYGTQRQALLTCTCCIFSRFGQHDVQRRLPACACSHTQQSRFYPTHALSLIRAFHMSPDKQGN